MKAKLKEHEIDTLFEECLFGNTVLNEELNKTDEKKAKQLAKKEIKDYLSSNRNKELEDKIKEVVKDTIKGDKDVENRFEEMVRSMMIELYKTFWAKRNQIFKSLKSR